MIKPITDLSKKAVSLARQIDRLPSGDYSIQLVKCDDVWQAEIKKTEPVRIMIINKT